MELKDRKLAEMVEASGSKELIYRVIEWLDEDEWDKEAYPTEAHLVLNCAEEIIEDYRDDGCCFHDDLLWARKVNRERDTYTVNLDCFAIKRKHTLQDVESADAIIAEYNNTRAFIKKLRRMV